MAKTTGDIIVEKLLDLGRGHGLRPARRRDQWHLRGPAQESREDPVHPVPHEEAAAFAACGYAKFTGRLGVCFATSGPGAIHLLNGLYDAKLDHAPVLAITGHTYHDQIGTFFQQEIDILALFEDVADYNQHDPRGQACAASWSTWPAGRPCRRGACRT